MSPRKINQATVLLLLLGFGSALTIYLRAKPVVVDPLIGDPLTSKKYLHQLRVLGGNANVAFAEFQAWLESLWQGENLAVTVAVLTVVATLIFRFVAAHPEIFAPDPFVLPPAGPPRTNGPKSPGPAPK